MQLLEINSEPAIELTGPRLTWILRDLFCSIAKCCVEPFFSSEGEDNGRGAWFVGDERHNMKKCLDTKVRGSAGW